MVGRERFERMNWWLIPVFGLMGLFGLAAGWFVGTILLAFKDEPMNVWEDWDE